MGYYLLYGICRTIAALPLRVLFVFADIVLYPMIYHVAGYRKKVVRRNLAASFPDKTPAEQKAIERGFYHHFCDYMVESLKMLHYSKKEMKKHMIFNNLELVHELYGKGRSCFMLVGHYGNWEWIASLAIQRPDGLHFGELYRPLKNKTFDRFFLNLRSRFGFVGIPKNEVLREVIGFKRDGQPFLIGTLADQTPSEANIHYYTTFLNQDTPVLTGTERMAKKVNAAVVYLDVVKVRRGYYECRFEMIAEHPNDTAEFEITERYMRKMEQTILRDPAPYLWTHKRWKHSRYQVNN